ncbi:MAG: hypothetical protein M3Y87_10325 [Myxococcota bacterium]|nr:hypothetical protein [Myxococcota bacterium]
MDWQTVVVIGIELAAVLFLVQRLVIGRRPRAPRALQTPDVPTSALLRKRR